MSELVEKLRAHRAAIAKFDALETKKRNQQYLLHDLAPLDKQLHDAALEVVRTQEEFLKHKV